MGDGCCNVACVIRCWEHIIKYVNKGETIDEIYLDFRKALSSPYSILMYRQSAEPRKYKLLKWIQIVLSRECEERNGFGIKLPTRGPVCHLHLTVMDGVLLSKTFPGCEGISTEAHSRGRQTQTETYENMGGILASTTSLNINWQVWHQHPKIPEEYSPGTERLRIKSATLGVMGVVSLSVMNRDNEFSQILTLVRF